MRPSTLNALSTKRAASFPDMAEQDEKPTVDLELPAELADRIEIAAAAAGLSTQNFMKWVIAEYIDRHAHDTGYVDLVLTDCPSCGELAPERGPCAVCGHTEDDKSTESE